MKIADFMTRDVECVSPADTLARTRSLMDLRRVNQLPVVRDGQLVGIVTDRDLRDAEPSVFERVQRELEADILERRGGPRPSAAETDPERMTVDVVMTPSPIAMRPDESLEEAAEVMRRRRIGALPVVEEGRLVGIVARSDVLDAFVALAREAGETTGA